MRSEWVRYISVLETEPGVRRVVLFGSRAKVIHDRGSDIDSACFGIDLDLTAMNRLRSRFDDLPTPYTFDFVHYESITNEELVAHIDRVGIPILER